MYTDIIDDLTNFFDQIMQFFTDVGPIVTALILSIGLVLVVYIIGKFLKLFVRKMQRIPDDAKNGVNIVIGVLQLVVIYFGIGSILDTLLAMESSILVSTSTVIATAIGFASTSAASNLVGGLYIISTRPFGVGDFISTSNNEGIVTKIGILYSEILQINKSVVTIPNSNLMNATLLNSNIKLKKQTKNDTSTNKKQSSERSRYHIPSFVSTGLKETFSRKEIVRYVTKLNLDLSEIGLVEAETRLDAAVKASRKLFAYPITYYFGEYSHRQDVFLVITSKSPKKIMENYHKLLENIVTHVFAEKQTQEAVA